MRVSSFLNALHASQCCGHSLVIVVCFVRTEAQSVRPFSFRRTTRDHHSQIANASVPPLIDGTDTPSGESASDVVGLSDHHVLSGEAWIMIALFHPSFFRSSSSKWAKRAGPSRKTKFSTRLW